MAVRMNVSLTQTQKDQKDTMKSTALCLLLSQIYYWQKKKKPF